MSFQRNAYSIVVAACFCWCALSLLVSCGGGGTTSPQSQSPSPVPLTATGIFLDAPVEGLSYSSGSISGLTNADGTFTYVPGSRVLFKIGDIEIGDAPGKSVITPVDLARSVKGHEGAYLDDGIALNIVRLLLAFNSSADSSVKIVIDQTIANSLKGKSLVLSDNAAVEALVRSVKPGAVVPDSAAAQTHLSSSLGKLYAGTYQGTYSGNGGAGPVSGRWNITIDTSRSLTGKIQIDEGNGRLTDYSLYGAIDTQGKVLFSDVPALTLTDAQGRVFFSDSQNLVGALLYCTGPLDGSTGAFSADCSNSTGYLSITFTGGK